MPCMKTCAYKHANQRKGAEQICGKVVQTKSIMEGRAKNAVFTAPCKCKCLPSLDGPQLKNKARHSQRSSSKLLRILSSYDNVHLQIFANQYIRYLEAFNLTRMVIIPISFETPSSNPFYHKEMKKPCTGVAKIL